MDRTEIKSSFRELLHEDFNFDLKDRNLILEVINHLEDVKGKNITDTELAEKCRYVYHILKGKEIFKDFISVLKEEKKVGEYHNTIY